MHLVTVTPGLTAAWAVIARLLRGPPDRPLLILDYRGVGDRILTPDDIARLCDQGIAWIDLGDLDRPCRILELDAACSSKARFERLLLRFARVLELPLEPADTDEAREFASRILGAGAQHAQGLLDFRSSVANEELCRWAWPSWNGSPESRARRDRVDAVLDAALRYPHLVAAAAAPDRMPDLAPGGSRWIWVELPKSHVEATEWALLAMALHGLAESTGGPEEDPRRLPVLLYPPSAAALGPLLPTAATAGAMALAIALHPSGLAPHLLRALVDAGDPVQVEVSGAIPPPAMASWRALSGDLKIDWESTSDGIAFTIRHGAAERTAPRLLRGAERAREGHLTDLREASRRGRRVIPLQHLGGGGRAVAAGASPSRDPFDRLTARCTLLLAWSALVTSRSSSEPGVDQVRPRAFGARLDEEIEALAAELREERYQPLPPTWITIPKASGGSRRIGISAVRDRVAQRAFVYVSEPLFEPHFSDRSFAFRPGRSAHHAAMALLGAMRRGYQYLAHVDVRSCFDSLPHEVILTRYGARIGSPRMLSLLSRWLRFGLGTEGLPDALGVGVVQGWVLSPFLSNVVLDDLDTQLEARGVEFVRYADDLGLLARNEKECGEAVELVDRLLQERLQLRLNPKKTQVRPLAEGGDYLGLRIGGSGGLAISPERFVVARQALCSSVRDVALVKGGPREVAKSLSRVARQLDGMAAYFCRLGMTRALEHQFAALRDAIEGERAALAEEVRDLPGWARIPSSEDLLARYGRLEAPQPGRGGKLPGSDPLEGTYGSISPPGSTSWMVDPVDLSGLLARVDPAAPDPVTPGPAPPTPPPAPSASVPVPSVERDGPTLHILRGGIGIYADEDELWLRRRGQEIFRAPLCGLELIVAQAHGIHFSSRAAWSLAAHRVSVLCFNPGGDDIAVLAAPTGPRAAIRIAQARRLDAPEVEAAALAMLRAKITNQASVLRYLARAPARRDGPAGGRLIEAAEEIRKAADRLVHAAAEHRGQERIAVLMGHEGQAAARYWTALAGIVPDELGFPGRRTRGACDPVNQALNYAYGCLYADIWRAVVRVGLDPGVGLLHIGPRADGGLVYDLIEELRAPLVDRLVFSLLGRGWTPQSKRAGAPALTPRGRHLLSRAFRRQRARPIRRGRGRVIVGELPALQATALQQLFLEQRPTYSAFHFRW